MDSNIRYNIALDESDEFVEIDMAEKGKVYRCPECKELFVFRRGKIKRPHFAHKNITTNCTPESVLHFLFKERLFDKIKKSIDYKWPIEMTWSCEFCHQQHRGNLIKKASRVEKEYDMGVCRPDIALLGGDNCVFAVIEIIVSHEPEDCVIEYYKKNNIILIQIELTSEDDLKNVDSIIARPSSIDFCVCPKCKVCNSALYDRELVINKIYCKGCCALIWDHVTIKGYNPYSSDRLRYNNFLRDEITLIASKGINLKKRTPRYYERTISCLKCGIVVKKDSGGGWDFNGVTKREFCRIKLKPVCYNCTPLNQPWSEEHYWL